MMCYSAVIYRLGSFSTRRLRLLNALSLVSIPEYSLKGDCTETQNGSFGPRFTASRPKPLCGHHNPEAPRAGAGAGVGRGEKEQPRASRGAEEAAQEMKTRRKPGSVFLSAPSWGFLPLSNFYWSSCFLGSKLAGFSYFGKTTCLGNPIFST